jgi:hypothetical protein
VPRHSFTGWNKGFGLPRELVATLAAMRVTVSVDLYAYGEDEA